MLSKLGHFSFSVYLQLNLEFRDGAEMESTKAEKKISLFCTHCRLGHCCVCVFLYIQYISYVLFFCLFFLFVFFLSFSQFRARFTMVSLVLQPIIHFFFLFHFYIVVRYIIIFSGLIYEFVCLARIRMYKYSSNSSKQIEFRNFDNGPGKLDHKIEQIAFLASNNFSISKCLLLF